MKKNIIIILSLIMSLSLLANDNPQCKREAELDSYYIINASLDSIMRKTISAEYKKGYYHLVYALILVKKGNDIYVEFASLESHNVLIALLHQDQTAHFYKRGSKPLGCVLYNDCVFYVILDGITSEESKLFFRKAPMKIHISEIEDTKGIYFFEQPLQVYRYSNGGFEMIIPSTRQ